MKRRVLSILLAVCLFIGCLPISAGAAEEPETPTVLEMQESYKNLPAYYNAMEEGYVSRIKGQQRGNCWAYATISSVETSLLKQGIAQDCATLDLSEDQLTDAMFTRSDDPLHNTAGDMNFTKVEDEEERFGAELSWAAQLLASGLGPADEQDYLDRGTGHQFDSDLSKADFWSCAFVPTTEQDLKRAIYQYGSVSISTWIAWHSIALIGWNDDYEGWPLIYDDYVLVPGVFLAKDSSGGSIGPDKVNRRIPYDDISYVWDDDGMPQVYEAVAYEYRDKDTYDNVYLYDGSGFSGEVEAQKAAAVFEAKAGTDDQAEQIVSATLPLASLDTTVSVQIYTDLQDPSDPESGTPLFEPGKEPVLHADYSGMYSVDFREFGKAVPLRQGGLFSVVMTLPKGGSVLTACEGTYLDIFYNKENIEQGQTFFYGCESRDGWTDGVELSHTARLHVQTKMVPISELPPHVHSYGENWENDGTGHWKECACGDKADQAAHTKTWGNDATQHWTKCNICGWVDAAKTNHIYDNGQDAACNMCGYERTVVPPAPSPSTPGPDGPDTPDEPVTWENPYSDVKEANWYYAAVRFANENGLFYGTSDTTFTPNGDMSRGMLAAVLFRLAKEPAAAADGLFDDVADGRYYSEAIAWAAENGIAAGYGNGRFGPEDSITREQLVTMLHRYAEKIGAGSGNRKAVSGFPDGDSVAGFAKDAMEWAVAEGLLSGRAQGGKSYLAPQGTASRAEVAAVLARFVEYLKK